MDILRLREKRLQTTREGLGVQFYRDGLDGDGVPTIVAHKSEQIKTLDELLDASKVNRSEWEVERWKPNVWNSFSNANGLIHLFQVTAQLRRKALSPEHIDRLVEQAFAGVKRAIKMPLVKPKPSAVGKMFMLGVPDLHLGKLAWGPETGHGNWDCNIAKKVWEEAIDDLITQAPDCEECWLPLGSDFFNVDNHEGKTTNGTPQDEDGRWQKTFDLGIEICMWAIARCRKKFPKVKIIMVYGNHDNTRSYMLGKVLEAEVRHMEGVSIDCGRADRKYFQWGNTGIGIAHGARLKEKDIPNLFAFEAAEIWGRTKRREFIFGHVHHSVTKEIGGVLARWISALCAPDYWHSKSGYVMAEKTACGFVYDQIGMRSQIMHYPNPTHYL